MGLRWRDGKEDGSAFGVKLQHYPDIGDDVEQRDEDGDGVVDIVTESNAEQTALTLLRWLE